MDIYPIKAQYISGENVVIKIELNGTVIEKTKLIVRRLADIIVTKEIGLIESDVDLDLGRFDTEFAGYSVNLECYANGKSVLFSTAFDVVRNPLSSIRYGFLSDFAKKDIDNGAIEWLRKCHINLVQYYDWSYRHDNLVSDAADYVDMMGKKINRECVCSKVRKTHELGMRSIAYGAVYAAGKEYFEDHKEDALYTSAGEPFVFINTFYIMNISRNKKWREHLACQYINAMKKMGFDGIHMDTYGFPKKAFDHNGNLIYLDEEFGPLIDHVRMKYKDEKLSPCLIFNNVGNWPVYATAKAAQDAVYIEVWDPYSKYLHLAEIIKEARCYSGDDKPIILAAYIKPFRTESVERGMNAARLAMSAIVSMGAYHLLIGEKQAALTQGYYSDYTKISDPYADTIRSYYDFLIKYMELFYDRTLKDVSMTHFGGDNEEYKCISHDVSPYGEAGKIWMILRENKYRKLIALINMTCCDNDLWNEGKEEPKEITDIELEVQNEKDIKGVYFASADRADQSPVKLMYIPFRSDRGQNIKLKVPYLKYWSIIWIDL